MKEHSLNKIENAKIIFKTKSKQKILDVFYQCKSIYKLTPEELVIIDNQMCLPINLDKWVDIDNPDNNFLNVLKVLEKITRPKGTPLTTISATLIGFDKDKALSFSLNGDYINGKHVLTGNYSNGEKMLYQEKLYLIE